MVISTIPRRPSLTDSNIAFQTVTSMFTSIHKTDSTISRAIGLLLVVFILYGTTVEAAHRHGRVLSGGTKSSSVVNPRNEDGRFGGKTGCSDCLICQLHQNFSATLVSVRPDSASTDAHSFTERFDPVSIGSGVNTPRSGRAPPKA
jgi:hypothetical protein